MLCPLSVALCGVKLRSCKFSGECLEVCVDDVRDLELLVMVLEGELVLALFRHLHPDSLLTDSLAFWLVGF